MSKGLRFSTTELHVLKLGISQLIANGYYDNQDNEAGEDLAFEIQKKIVLFLQKRENPVDEADDGLEMTCPHCQQEYIGEDDECPNCPDGD